MLNSFLAIALALGLAGCEDVRPGQAASDIERDAAQALLTQLAVISAQPTTPDDVLRAASSAPVVTLVAPAGTPVAMPDSEAREQDLGGCLIATDTSAAYSECSVAEHVVDGIWSAQLDRIYAEWVDVFVAAPGVHGSVAVEANLALGNEFSGTLDTAVMWSVGDGDYVLDATIRVDGLVLESPSCATAGTITITGELGDAPATSSTLWFGPGCQDILISR